MPYFYQFCIYKLDCSKSIPLHNFEDSSLNLNKYHKWKMALLQWDKWIIILSLNWYNFTVSNFYFFSRYKIGEHYQWCYIMHSSRQLWGHDFIMYDQHWWLNEKLYSLDYSQIILIWREGEGKRQGGWEAGMEGERQGRREGLRGGR